MSEEQKETHQDEQGVENLIQAARTAESIALIPVLNIIRETTGLDLSTDYGVDTSIAPGCVELKKKDGSVIHCRLAVVERSYDFLSTLSMHEGFHGVKTMDDIHSEDDCDVKQLVIEVVSHLCRCALFVFNNVRNKYVEITDLHLQMSDNTTLYISKEDDMNLGIVFY